MGGTESCASPTPPPALAAPPPPSEGRGLWRQSWLGLDAISAAEQGSLAGSNFLIRTPGLPARWFSALTPLLQNRTPQASPQTTHTHREPHVYKSEGLQWGHRSGTGHRRGAGAKPSLQRPRSRSRLLTQLLDACFRLLHPPCLPLIEWIPNPRTERAGWGNQSSADHTTTREKAPSTLWPISSGSAETRARRWALGRQPPPPAPRQLQEEGGLRQGRGTEAL